MKKTLQTLLAVLMIAGMVPAFAFDGDPAAGQQKSTTCIACHGTDGNSQSAQYPKIAGQHPQYLYKQLKNYKSGERQNAIMAGMVAALSDEDMRNLAAYFAAQEISDEEADPELVDQGRKIYRGGKVSAGIPACMGCHGPAGLGNPMAKFPRLNGQHPEYTVTQLEYFRSEERANDAGRMMRNVAHRMTDEEMKAVAEYLAGLQGREATAARVIRAGEN